MQPHAFDVLRSAEGSWWDYGRQRAAAAMLAGRRFASILDFGAGFGAESSFLSGYGPVDGYEPIGVEALSEKPYRRTYTKEAEALAEPHDLIALFDVIAHVPDREALLRRLHDALAPGERLLITTPAYQWLWGAHDIVQGHTKRFTRRTLRAELRAAGFSVERIGYWNMALLAPAASVRLLNLSGESALEAPEWASFFLRGWLWFEGRLARVAPLPFGLSVIALARRA
jgi:SAM-dependent methyltransferase